MSFSPSARLSMLIASFLLIGSSARNTFPLSSLLLTPRMTAVACVVVMLLLSTGLFWVVRRRAPHDAPAEHPRSEHSHQSGA